MPRKAETSMTETKTPRKKNDPIMAQVVPFSGDTKDLETPRHNGKGQIVGPLHKKHYIAGDSLIAIWKGRGGSVKRRGIAFVGAKVSKTGRRTANPLRQRLIKAGVPVLS